MSGRQRQGQQGPHPAAPGRAAWGQGVRGPKNDGCKTWDVTFWQLVRVGKSWLFFIISCPHHVPIMSPFGVGCFGHQVMMLFPARSYAAIAAHPDCNPLLPDNDGKSDDPEMSIWDPQVQDLNLADFPMFFQGRPWSMPPIGVWRLRAEM